MSSSSELLLFFNKKTKLSYYGKLLGTQRANLIGYWPLWDTAGSTAAIDLSPLGNNGIPTGATFGQPGIGDGRTSAWFTSVTFSNISILNGTFAANFSKAEGTAMAWAKVNSAADWTETGSARRIISIRTDGTNQVQIAKNVANNDLIFQYIANNNNELFDLTPVNPITWFHVAITWSVAADQVKFFYNGAQVSTTRTALGTWSAAALANATISSLGGTGNYWHGWLAHAAVWKVPLTPTEVANLAYAPFLS